MESSSQYGFLAVPGYVQDMPQDMCVVTVIEQKFDKIDCFMCLRKTLNERL